MKIVFICFTLLIVQVYSSDWKPKENVELVEIRDECLSLENVSHESQLKIKQSEYPDEPSVRCYVRCTSKKVGTWNDETGPDVERTWRQIQKSGNNMPREDVVKCVPPKQEDLCAWAYQGLMCLLKSEGITNDLIK